MVRRLFQVQQKRYAQIIFSQFFFRFNVNMMLIMTDVFLSHSF